MTYFTDRKIAKAARDYDLTEAADASPATFSEPFERKMTKLIRRQRRMQKLASAVQGTAVITLLAVTVGFGAWATGMLELPGMAGSARPGAMITIPDETAMPLDEPTEAPLDEPAEEPIVDPTAEPAETPNVRYVESTQFASWAEARQTMPFELIRPSYLPEEVGAVRLVGILDEDLHLEDFFLFYKKSKDMESDVLTVRMGYRNIDATTLAEWADIIRNECKQDVEFLQWNGAELLIVRYTNEKSMFPHSLLWMNGEHSYSISGKYDLDTLLAVYDSLEPAGDEEVPEDFSYPIRHSNSKLTIGSLTVRFPPPTPGVDRMEYFQRDVGVRTIGGTEAWEGYDHEVHDSLVEAEKVYGTPIFIPRAWENGDTITEITTFLTSKGPVVEIRFNDYDFVLEQRYVGDEPVVMYEVGSLSKTTVGGNEAVWIDISGGWLYWIQDGYLYKLQRHISYWDTETVVDKDYMVRLAESMAPLA